MRISCERSCAVFAGSCEEQRGDCAFHKKMIEFDERTPQTGWGPTLSKTMFPFGMLLEGFSLLRNLFRIILVCTRVFLLGTSHSISEWVVCDSAETNTRVCKLAISTALLKGTVPYRMPYRTLYCTVQCTVRHVQYSAPPEYNPHPSSPPIRT
jgi:hypothetical protein